MLEGNVKIASRLAAAGINMYLCLLGGYKFFKLIEHPHLTSYMIARTD